MGTEKRKGNKPVEVVKKPYATGNATDENTLRSSLIFMGSLLIVYFMTFLVTSMTGFDSVILRILVNGAIITVTMLIFYNNGSNQGADAVKRGEIIWQKMQSGQLYTESEKSVCFHRLKGFLIGLFGTLPVFILAVIFAFSVQKQLTDAGGLPSWMQTYSRRADVGNALVNYTNPEGMSFVDYLRIIIRISIMPFVSIVGHTHKEGMYVIEKISPLLLLLPASFYGAGYLTGRGIRTKVHTAITANDKKRARKEMKARKARNKDRAFRTPEKLN